mgnify:FL=1
MHDGKIPMTLSMETLYNAFVSIENINRGAKTIFNDNALDAFLMTISLNGQAHKLANG